MITVAMPVYRSREIAWLPMESLCRQETNHKWELLICEEIHPEQCGRDFFETYRPRLEKAGCVNLEYIELAGWVNLPEKWRIMANRALGKIFLLQAADDFSDCNRLERSFESLQDADWTHDTKGHFYQAGTGMMSQFDLTTVFNWREGRTGLNMAVRTELLKDLPPTDKIWGIDGWLRDHCKTKTGVLKININDGDYGCLDVDGVNNLSIVRNEKFTKFLPPFIPAKKGIAEILPPELIEKLKAVKPKYEGRTRPGETPREMKGTIGACMIVKNEESCLGKCLESIQGVDEIVILDTGSKDKTGDIARKYTDKIIEGVYFWEDDFSKARNKALEFATADWILVIDADETLSEDGLFYIREAIKKANSKTLCFKMDVVSENETVSHNIVRVHRRHPDIYWKGAAHNYLTVQDGPEIDAVITYGWSKAHELDPDRTLRILKKFVKDNPTKPRELYYLAREFFQRENYKAAKKWYQKYLQVATWAPEIADAHLMMAKCAVGLDDIDLAWMSAFKALQINADLSEGLKTLAALSGPNNRRKWLKYAKLANNEKALFARDIPGLEEPKEKGADYYSAIYADGYDTSRYDEIYRQVAAICKGKVLDMGCGTGDLRRFLNSDVDYTGFDFACPCKADCFHLGNIYEYPIKGFDTYVCLEVLEHIDDIRAIKRIPQGSIVIFSVPSFPDTSHLRTYTFDMMIDRYQEYFSEMEVRRYNWHGGKWANIEQETENYILLVKAVRR